MKVTAMMYNEEMMRAHLREIEKPGSGKRMTRRLFKVNGVMPRTSFTVESPDEKIIQFDDGSFHYLSTVGLSGPYPCPYGQPGDLLWFREPMRVIHMRRYGDVVARPQAIHAEACVKYLADGAESNVIEWPSRLKERPVLGKCLSNGGPREFSRMTGLITSVRVERLQDISDEDASAEGVPQNDRQGTHYGDARTSFICLWDSIYFRSGKGWGANPWVWVIEYKPMLVNVDEYIKQMEAHGNG